MGKRNKHYGMIIGSFQPLHIGHMLLINEMIDAKMEPLIIIQEEQGSNVFSSSEIIDLIMDSYRGWKMTFIKTQVKFEGDDLNESVDKLLFQITRAINGLNYRNITLFTSKEMDQPLIEEYRGSAVTTFSDIFQREGFAIRDIPAYEDPIRREIISSGEMREVGFAHYRCSVSPAVFGALIGGSK